MKKNKLTNSYSAKPIKDVEIEIGDSKDTSVFQPDKTGKFVKGNIPFAINIRLEIKTHVMEKRDILKTKSVQNTHKLGGFICQN